MARFHLVPEANSPSESFKAILSTPSEEIVDLSTTLPISNNFNHCTARGKTRTAENRTGAADFGRLSAASHYA